MISISYEQRQSNVITALRFPLMVMIVLLHASTAASYTSEKTIYGYVIYPFAMWLGESGVPTFFFISGFLFFFSNKSYVEKLKGRFYSLVIPYFLWNLCYKRGV